MSLNSGITWLYGQICEWNQTSFKVEQSFFKIKYNAFQKGVRHSISSPIFDLQYFYLNISLRLLILNLKKIYLPISISANVCIIFRPEQPVRYLTPRLYSKVWILIIYYPDINQLSINPMRVIIWYGFCFPHGTPFWRLTEEKMVPHDQQQLSKCTVYTYSTPFLLWIWIKNL